MATVAVTRGGPQAAVALAACAAAGTACLVWALRGRYLQVFLGSDPAKGGGIDGNGEKERQGVTLTSLSHLMALTGDSWHSSLQRLVIGQMVIGLKLTNDPRLAAIPSPLPASLAALASLRDVDLSANGLAAFPDALLSVPGLKKLSLSRNKLTSLPQAIAQLSHLEHLDLGRNHLTAVPEEIGHLTKLLTLNLMCNQLEGLPESIGRLTRVFRLGLKSNRLSALPSSIGGMTSLVELYLTDNRLSSLPDSLGCCTRLVKLQASFNQLHSLPASIGSLSHLELLRLAANNLHSLPASLALLPHLAWVSLASNPFCPPLPPHHEGVEDIPFSELKLGKKLGDGASGDVYAALWHGHEVVFKQFNSETSPDGRAVDEIAMTAAVDHEHLVQVEATVEQPHGLVMRRVFGSAMADPPNADSLLRCRWTPTASYSLASVLAVGSGLASALEWMHARGWAHGDVYAHNVLVNDEGFAVLCDYGASFPYPRHSGIPFESHEVRALALLLQGLFTRLAAPETTAELTSREQLGRLIEVCVGGTAGERPRFKDVREQLASIHRGHL
ncbi:hypothetical protein CLOP_g12485 [Closterium sp. NIES-67]|nr:hypothetical protein CLOP_g12485 [Closterium sp. NIES-67]